MKNEPIKEIANYIIDFVEKPVNLLKFLTDCMAGADKEFSENIELREFILQFIDVIVVPWLEAGEANFDGEHKGISYGIQLMSDNYSKDYFELTTKMIQAYNLYNAGDSFGIKMSKIYAHCITAILQIGSINSKQVQS